MSDSFEVWAQSLLNRYDFSFSENMRVAFDGENYRYERISAKGELIAFSQWISLKQAVSVQNVFFNDGKVGNVIFQPQLVWTEVRRE